MHPPFDRILLIAVLVEVTTNCVKRVAPNLEKQHVTLVAGTLGILMAVITNTGLLTAMDIPVRSIAVDFVITGIIVSRGSNIVHDIAKKLNF